MTALAPSFESIVQAQASLKNLIVTTPCKFSPSLSKLLAANVYLKLESNQHTGSFKDRGALHKTLLLDKQQCAAGVIAASAGNHAQAVAYAARQRNIKATIVMPETAPLTKVRGTQSFGAEIVLHGSSYAEAYEKANELCQQHGYTFIHAFDDPEIIAGQGTIGLELLVQLPEIDAAIIPIGGGGLISGTALALKTAKPDTLIIGVQAERLPAMKESIAAKELITLRAAGSIADGILIAKVGKWTLPIVMLYVSEVVTVTENEIARAIMFLLEHEKTLAEGAGAVGIAALLQHKIASLKGKTVAVVISGGNIDMSALTLILERALEADSRIAHLTIVVPDKPGSIASLATAVAKHRANILHIFQSRHFSEVELGEIEVELTIETKGETHVSGIANSIRELGYRIK